MPLILFIAKVIFASVIIFYVTYGLAFGIAAACRRRGGEH